MIVVGRSQEAIGARAALCNSYGITAEMEVANVASCCCHVLMGLITLANSENRLTRLRSAAGFFVMQKSNICSPMCS